MSNQEPLPPSLSSGVVSITVSTLIGAPRQKVWDVLLDFPSYPQWNPFVRSQTVVDQSRRPVENQTPSEGAYLLMKTNMPPSMDQTDGSHSALDQITVIDHENYRAAWVYIQMPAWILHAERWQILTEVDGKTKYESTEVFSGLAAYILKWFMVGKLRVCFDAFADALKKRSEEQ